MSAAIAPRLKSVLGMRLLLAGLLSLLLTGTAHAGPGTPLMVAQFAHLVVGNALIGACETVAMNWYLERSGKEPMPGVGGLWWIIAGNYASCVAVFNLLYVGRWLLGHVASPLRLLVPLLVLLLVLSFLLSVAVEWPFLFAALGRRSERLRQSIRITIVAQTASYLLIVAYYTLVPGCVSLLTEAILSDVPGTAREPIARVYYINPNDGDVWSVLTNGTGRQQMHSEELKHPEARLFVRRDNGQVGLYTNRGGNTEAPDPLLSFPSSVRYAHQPSGKDDPGHDSRMSFRRLEFLPPSTGTWSAETGFWPDAGVFVLDGKRPAYRLAIALPVAQLRCRNLTVLPNDQAVLQIGEEIVLLDLPSRQLTILARGRGPAVVQGPETRNR